MGKQIELLKYHPHFPADPAYVAAFIRDHLAIYDDLAGGRLLQKIQTADEG